jgi:ArsR family transcriptional regulator
MARPGKTRLSQEQFEAISRALADPRRYAILQQIARCPSVGCSALEEHKHISPATISHHMKELQEAGLVDIVREGRSATLSLKREVWKAYLDSLASL